MKNQATSTNAARADAWRDLWFAITTEIQAAIRIGVGPSRLAELKAIQRRYHRNYAKAIGRNVG